MYYYIIFNWKQKKALYKLAWIIFIKKCVCSSTKIQEVKQAAQWVGSVTPWSLLHNNISIPLLTISVFLSLTKGWFLQQLGLQASFCTDWRISNSAPSRFKIIFFSFLTEPMWVTLCPLWTLQLWSLHELPFIQPLLYYRCFPYCYIIGWVDAGCQKVTSLTVSQEKVGSGAIPVEERTRVKIQVKSNKNRCLDGENQRYQNRTLGSSIDWS